MTTDLLYIGLRDALLENACPLCWRMDGHTRRTIVHFLREGKGADQIFLSLARSLGLCQRHAWLLAEIEPEAFGDGMATATLYDWLVDHLVRTIQWNPLSIIFRRRGWFVTKRQRSANPRAQALINQLAQTDSCCLCRLLGDYERVLAWGLQRFLSDAHGDDRFRDLFRKSWGLCLPHFRMVLFRVEDDSTLDILIDVQRERMEALSGDLKEYLRKHDYRFAHEPYGPERDSWIRAIALFAGGAPREISTRDAESRAGRKTKDE
jgi:hypothetical protein